MSSTDENSTSDDDSDFNETYMSGSNAFAFEPEYTEEEVQERLMQHFSQNESDAIVHSDDESACEDGEWCNCEHCVIMPNDFEQVCCIVNSSIIGNKFGVEKCIAHTIAFRDVCLNINVLQAALGT